MITREKMQEIYEQIKTPYKRGAVVKFQDSLVDSPTVFRHGDKWYMYFVRILKEVATSGYETHFASSDDLIHWNDEGVILRRTDTDTWDCRQRGGYAAFVDPVFGGSNEIQPVNGMYYMAYIGGALDGYETDPLSIGLAVASNPADPDSFRVLEQPVLGPRDNDARYLESKTLFKSDMFRDERNTLGHPYVNAYNAKAPDARERVFLAVSDDGEHWERYGEKPILDETETVPGLKITGDPQIVQIGELYVMFFFRWVPGTGAYNMFACSEDLVNWTVWDGEPLIRPAFDWEDTHAHKSYVVKHNGVVYHYYCAVNSIGERFIALATSEEV